MVVPVKKTTPKGAKTEATKLKVVKKTAGGLVESDLIDRSFNVADQTIINIHGPAGGGKTIAALTASEYWPKAGMPNTKPVMLRDTMHIGWDAAALVGAAAQNISVAYAINVPHLLSKQRKSGKRIAEDVTIALDMIVEEIGTIIAKDPNIRLAIDDTISRFDRYLFGFWSHPSNIPESRDGEADTRGLYRCMFTCHNQYQSERIQLPADVTNVFLFHCRVIGDEDAKTLTKDQKERGKITRLNADVTIIPQVTGQGLDLYTNDASIEFACVPVKAPKGTAPERRLYVMPHRGFRTKNRFQELFKAEYVPAHLGKIMDKIRQACK